MRARHRDKRTYKDVWSVNQNIKFLGESVSGVIEFQAMLLPANIFRGK